MNQETITVHFPLQGEWIAARTPGHQIPSHGTDDLGQTYAFDFVGVDPDSVKLKITEGSSLKSLIAGNKLEAYFGWSQSILAPFDGRVVERHDGYDERARVHLVSDLAVVLWNAVTFDIDAAKNFQQVCGNYLILESNGIFALIAHIKKNSITVREGEQISVGQRIAEVGHSGNSTAPHLHFHLMDSPDLTNTHGLPCRFSAYERFSDGQWSLVEDGVPGRMDRMRLPIGIKHDC